MAWGGAGADSENGQDSHGHADSNIYMRSMDSAGRFLGGDVRVNRKTEGSQSAPKMASLHNNRAVIAWQDFGGVDGDGSGYVHTVLDSQARPMLGEQPSYPASEGQGYQGFGGVTDLNDGGYVVTWEDRRGDRDVKMQRFGPNARPKGEVVTLADPSTGRQQFPALAGGFKSVTAAWQDFGGTGSDKESSASIGRTFRF